MGLDGVELVMAVEEHFGIELTDAEVERTITPRDLIEVVLGKMQATEWSVCLTRRAFYALRRVLMQDFGCKRADITPNARLESLVPRPNRRRAWQQMESSLKAQRWPRLGRPAGVLIAVGVLVAVVAVVASLWGWPFWTRILLAMLAWSSAMMLTRPLCVEFKDLATAGELAQFLVAAAPNIFEPKGREWSRADVAEAIRSIVITQLGLKPEQYREDARFVQDLGAG